MREAQIFQRLFVVWYAQMYKSEDWNLDSAINVMFLFEYLFL